MRSYSRSKKYPLEEVEVFVGSIIGTNGALSKRQRERDQEMKESFDRAVADTIACISKSPTTADDGEDAKYGPLSAYAEDGEEVDEALERSIACLSVALEGQFTREGYKHLRSFMWVAAAVCLRELEKFQWEMRGKGAGAGRGGAKVGTGVGLGAGGGGGGGGGDGGGGNVSGTVGANGGFPDLAKAQWEE